MKLVYCFLLGIFLTSCSNSKNIEVCKNCNIECAKKIADTELRKCKSYRGKDLSINVEEVSNEILFSYRRKLNTSIENVTNSGSLIIIIDRKMCKVLKSFITK